MNTTLEFVTHNSDEIETGGSSLKGEISASYAELLSIFGDPHESDGYKSDAEWDVRFGDGTVATIYNWKDGPNYCGKDGTPVEQIKEWHVGGHTPKALERVQITLQLHREMKAEQKDKNPIEQITDAREDMLKSISSQRGRPYSRTVLVAHLVKKQMDIFMILMEAAKAKVPPPPSVEGALVNAMAHTCAEIVNEMSEVVGVVENRKEAEELMKWADRLAETEMSVVASIKGAT